MAWLRELDQARYEDPERVLSELEAARSRVPASHQPRYFGVYGSTHRMLAGRSQQSEPCLERAEELLRFGRWIAERRGDDSAFADLLLRSSYVLSDRGDYRQALVLAEQANALFERCQDRVGRGRALFEQGRFLFYLNRTAEAIEAYYAALRLLPTSEQSNLFSVHQGLGLCFQRQGQYQKALKHALRAEALVPSPWFEAKLYWLQAHIYRGLEKHYLAEQRLTRAADMLSALHYGEAALAAVELVQLQMLQGKTKAAGDTLRSIIGLVIPLGGNHEVAAAIVELMRDKLTLEAVETARRQIETAKECSQWHSLAVEP
ncbi:MAG: hypothetical protein AAF560_29855 [Acidobacteriota bacterium]